MQSAIQTDQNVTSRGKLNMGKIKSFFIKYWLFILLATLATILSGFHLKNKFPSPQEVKKLLPLPLPSLESQSLHASPNISTLEKNFPSFEKNIAVYQVVSSPLSDQQAISIANRLGFTEPPTVSQNYQGDAIYDWSKEEKSLSINLRWGSINYHLTPSTPQNLTPLSFSRVENIAKNFLEENKFLPPEGIILKLKEISWANDFGYGIEKVLSSQNANLVQIDFEYEIDNKKLINSSVVIGVNFKEQITQFTYQYSFKEIKLLEMYPLKTKKEVIETIKTKPTISYLHIPNYYTVTTEEFKNITNVTFDNIELVYYKYDPLQSYLQPVFLITGKARLKDGQEGEVGLYLPAIKDEYLLK